MKIGVCLKQVPASDSRIKISDPSSGVSTAETKWEINPYDEYALEEALRLKDAKKAETVVVFSLGDKDSEQRIRDALARGADAAVRLDDPGFAGSDSLGVARALAAAIKAEGCSLVLCGKQAIDDDNAQVPAMIAELLGWPQVLVVDQLEINEGSFKAWRAAGGGARDVVEGSLPVVISADKGLNEPRYASLKGIMMAKKKQVDVRNASALGLSGDQVGKGGARVSLSNWSLPPDRPPGRMIQGDAATQARELVRLLREEAKVI